MKILSTKNQIKNFLGTEPLQTITIRVTKACNLRCLHCYSISGKKLKDELSLEEIKKVIDQAKELGAIRIFFTGGEPFIRPDILEILKYTDEQKFAMYISTNGTLLNKNVINSLQSLKHLRTLQFSIDGLSRTHDLIRGKKGTFKKAITWMKFAKKTFKNTNTKIVLIFVLTKKNKDEVTKVYKLAISLGVDAFGLIPLYPVKRSEKAEDISPQEKFRIFKDLCKIYITKKPKTKIGLLIPPGLIPKPLKEIEYGCGYVCSFPSMLGIDANGDVAPCDGLFSFKNFILGNVRKDSLKKIWNHPLMKKLREIKPSNLKGICKQCEYLEFCMGGCRARAFIEYGNFNAPNPLCQSFYDNNLFLSQVRVKK
jgi:radical SAM protein with 4Fe4S-binding SPASM domain